MVIVNTKAECQTYVAKLLSYHPINVTAEFRRAVSGLDYGENPDMGPYLDFIELFGTHYTTQVSFGSSAIHQYTMTFVNYTTIVEEGNSVSAGASLSFVVSFGFDASESNSKSDYENFSKRVSETRVLGIGTPPPFVANATNWNDWQKNIFKTPSPMYINIESLDTLFTPSIFPSEIYIDRKRNNLIAAYRIYCEGLAGCVPPPLPGNASIWSTEGGNFQRTNTNPTSGPSVCLIRWRLSVFNLMSNIVVNETAMYGCYSSVIFALDVSDGSLFWGFSISDDSSVYATSLSLSSVKPLLWCKLSNGTIINLDTNTGKLTGFSYTPIDETASNFVLVPNVNRSDETVFCPMCFNGTLRVIGLSSLQNKVIVNITVGLCKTKSPNDTVALFPLLSAVYDDNSAFVVADRNSGWIWRIFISNLTDVTSSGIDYAPVGWDWISTTDKERVILFISPTGGTLAFQKQFFMMWANSVPLPVSYMAWSSSVNLATNTLNIVSMNSPPIVNVTMMDITSMMRLSSFSVNISVVSQDIFVGKHISDNEGTLYFTAVVKPSVNTTVNRSNFRVYAVDQLRKQVKWVFSTKDMSDDQCPQIGPSVVLGADGTLYTFGCGNNLYAIARDGAVCDVVAN